MELLYCIRYNVTFYICEMIFNTGTKKRDYS